MVIQAPSVAPAQVQSPSRWQSGDEEVLTSPPQSEQTRSGQGDIEALPSQVML